jgi:beta-N-acetylhexosaminidase
VSAPGATILGCAGPALSPDERAFFAEAAPWGFILFERNIVEPRQLMRLTGALREAVGRDAPILIDQEGGRVQRMRPPHWRLWRPPLDQVALAGPGEAARSLRLRYRLIAEELRAVGIDVNCAPVADLARPETHGVLRNRCYGAAPVAVVGAARAVVDGLAEGGVLPVVKHIPGHGRARTDSHQALPVVDAPREVLETTDFAAFRALADLPMGMTAHVVYSALDDRPATLSPVVIAAIRQEIGFDGLLMTDDISMGALAGGMAARVAEARAAGCDVVLHCNGDRAEMAEVVAHAGRLSGPARGRADAALARRPSARMADIPALEAELAALLAGEPHD